MGVDVHCDVAVGPLPERYSHGNGSSADAFHVDVERSLLCDSSPPALRAVGVVEGGAGEDGLEEPRHLRWMSGLADGTVQERASHGDGDLPMIG